MLIRTNSSKIAVAIAVAILLTLTSSSSSYYPSYSKWSPNKTVSRFPIPRIKNLSTSPHTNMAASRASRRLSALSRSTLRRQHSATAPTTPVQTRVLVTRRHSAFGHGTYGPEEQFRRSPPRKALYAPVPLRQPQERGAGWLGWRRVRQTRSMDEEFFRRHAAIVAALAPPTEGDVVGSGQVRVVRCDFEEEDSGLRRSVEMGERKRRGIWKLIMRQ